MNHSKNRCAFRRGWVALTVIAVALVGCHQVTFVSPRTPVNTPVIKGELNSAIIADVVDVDMPIRTDLRCKAGWAKAELERSFVVGLIEMLGGWVYSGRSLTLYCGEGGAEVTTASGTSASVETSSESPEGPAPQAKDPAPAGNE